MGATRRRDGPLLAVIVAAMHIDGGVSHLYAAREFSLGGGDSYSFGTLDLSSPLSARAINKIVHTWTQTDLPGMSSHFCGPVIAGGADGAVYAFAGSGCVEDNGFYNSTVLAYNLSGNSTTVYDGIPVAVYHGDKNAATGPTFGTPLLDERRGVFYVVTSSSVQQYEFRLSMLLEFNPRTGKTTALAALPVDHDITAAIFDAQSQLVVLAVDIDTGDKTSVSHKTAVVDTRSGALAWRDFSSAALPRFAGFDPAAEKVLAIQNEGEQQPKTNYNVGYLTCDGGTACNFAIIGELDRLWSGPDTGVGAADKISGVAWDPIERLLSVQSSGCYNISAGTFDCYANLGTEKFMQYHIPAIENASSAGRPTRSVLLKASYTYMQVTNYNDGLAMDWRGLAHVA
jgi:hypothetical protein